MDAVKFLMEKERMCANYTYQPYSKNDCDDCPLNVNNIGCPLESMTREQCEKTVGLVEQWSKEHPQKTYRDDFLEKFPNAKSFDDDIPMVHWCEIYNNGNCKYGQDDGFNLCVNCWKEPME